MISNFIHLFLAFDLGFLLGIGVSAWFISKYGCYEGCKLSDKTCKNKQ